MSDVERRRLVRPYLVTGGRTRPVHTDLRLEALVESTPVGVLSADQHRHEHRAVLDLCQRPTSVAEVAALVQLPLGVARVLIDDLVLVGHVNVAATVAEDGPDVPLLERLLEGLRAL